MKNKLIIGIIAILMFAFSTGIGAAAKADFSGMWTLDAAKSEGLPPGLTSSMTVKQTGDRVEVETKLKMGEGEERTVKDVFVLNGKETDFTPPLIGGAGATVKRAKRTSRWMADGNGFEVTEEAVLNSPDSGEALIKVTRRWSLSADGKTLTADTNMQNPNGGSKSKRVFVKK
ncbi:MAG: hypothetical protein M3209_13130 [Acidobacteriota bacterium]|nr:hypothetical protein [Acidobacteriota bacterium]